MKNKKGSILIDSLTWIWKIIVVAMVVVYLIIVLVYFKNENFDTHEQEVYLLSKSLRYSEDCLALEPDLIDLDKLTSERLSSCYSDKSLGFRVTLLSFDRTPLKTAEVLSITQKTYLGEDLGVCQSLKRTHKCSVRTDLIKYKTDDAIKQGFLQLEVIQSV